MNAVATAIPTPNGRGCGRTNTLSSPRPVMTALTPVAATQLRLASSAPLTSLHDSEQQRTPACLPSGQVASQWNGQASNEVQTSSPRRRTKRQQQPSGYVTQSQKGAATSGRAGAQPWPGTPDGDSKRLLTSLDFDRNGLPLLPLLKASITGTLCPLEWRRRRTTPAVAADRRRLRWRSDTGRC